MWSPVYHHCLCTKNGQFLTAFLVAMKHFYLIVVACVHHSFKKRFIFSRVLQADERHWKIPISFDQRDSKQKDSTVHFPNHLGSKSADHMLNSGEIHLPFAQEKEVYELFVSGFQLMNGTNVSPPTLLYVYSTWSSYCGLAKNQKFQRSTLCAHCEQLRTSIEACLVAKADTTAIHSQKKVHIEMVAS